MIDILSQIYRGEIYPEEDVPVSEACLAQRRKVLKAQEALLAKLEEPLRAEVISMMETASFLTGMECECSYLAGMKLGAQLALELTGWKQGESEE